MQFEGGGNHSGVLVVRGHAQRHRLQTAPQGVGRQRVEDAAHEPARPGHGLEQPKRPGQHPRR